MITPACGGCTTADGDRFRWRWSGSGEFNGRAGIGTVKYGTSGQNTVAAAESRRRLALNRQAALMIKALTTNTDLFILGTMALAMSRALTARF
jgi:hypothetical protein